MKPAGKLSIAVVCVFVLVILGFESCGEGEVDGFIHGQAAFLS